MSQALIDEHATLGTEAAEHKRLANRHREQARRLRRRQSEIEAELTRLGIKLTVINGAGETIHGRQTSERRG